MRIIDNDFILLALINYKKETFDEKYTSLIELNKFTQYIQDEFNKRDLNVVIKTSGINEDCFRIIEMVLTKREDCYIDLDILPTDILNILTNKEIMSNFFLELENDKLLKIKKQK